MRLQIALLAAALAVTACQSPANAAECVVAAPAAKRVAHETGGLKTAIFSGGCFWGVEGVFSHVKGVHSAVSGYDGGNAKNPSYEEVSTGTTGYRESVKVPYDPKVVRYDRLFAAPVREFYIALMAGHAHLLHREHSGDMLVAEAERVLDAAGEQWTQI